MSNTAKCYVSINLLLEQILQSLKDEWISECDELCQILQTPHLISLLNVVDCVARQLYDLPNTDYDLSPSTSLFKYQQQQQQEFFDDHKLVPGYLKNDDDNDGMNYEKFDDYDWSKQNLRQQQQQSKPFIVHTRRKRQRKLFHCNQKIINVFKSNEPLGVTVRFDERTGEIVLARIMVGSAAYRSGLINVGDRILEVNGIKLRGRSHLDVINILQRECMKTSLTFKILIKNKHGFGGDGFGAEDSTKSIVVKAHFDYNPENDPLIPCPKIGLSFVSGSILNILNKDDTNWWQASKEIDSCSNKSRMEIFQIAGLIPSKSLQERRIVAIRDIKSQLDRERFVHILGGLIPLPFRKNKWCAQKIKKIMYDLSDCVKYDREEICTYEQVAKYFPRPGFSRPIILIGPSGIECQLLINILCNTYPERYREPLIHTTRFKRFQENDSIDYYFVDEQWMQQEIQSGNFVYYTEYRGNYYGIHKSTIKQLIDGGFVCIFKMDAKFLRLICTAEFKPFVIFIRPPYDVDQLLQIRKKQQQRYQNQNYYYNNIYYNDNGNGNFSSRKSDQRLRFEMHLIIYEAHRLQILYGHKFDSIIVLDDDDFNQSFKKFYDLITSIQIKPSWIPITWINNNNNNKTDVP